MPSLVVQELLVKQEFRRLEQLSRDAWLRSELPAAPVSRWRKVFARSATGNSQ